MSEPQHPTNPLDAALEELATYRLMFEIAMSRNRAVLDHVYPLTLEVPATVPDAQVATGMQHTAEAVLEILNSTEVNFQKMASRMSEKLSEGVIKNLEGPHCINGVMGPADIIKVKKACDSAAAMWLAIPEEN